MDILEGQLSRDSLQLFCAILDLGDPVHQLKETYRGSHSLGSEEEVVWYEGSCESGRGHMRVGGVA